MVPSIGTQSMAGLFLGKATANIDIGVYYRNHQIGVGFSLS